MAAENMMSFSDSDDTSLTIVLNSDSDADQNRGDSDHQMSDNDDLTIGCDEDEISVNLYVIARPEAKPKRMEKKNNKSDNNEKEEKVEVRSELKPKLFKCFICSFKTRQVSVLCKHLNKLHEEDHNKCQIGNCPYPMKPKLSLFEHAQFHGIEIYNDGFCCPRCSFQSHTQKEVLVHMKTCTKYLESDAIQIYNCPICSISDRSYQSILVHFKSHAIEHKDLRSILACPMCRIKTKKKRFYNHAKHHISVSIRLKESDYKQIYNCPVCPISMRSYQSILKHFKTHAVELNDIRNKVACPMCRMKMKKIRFDNKHAKIHISASLIREI